MPFKVAQIRKQSKTSTKHQETIISVFLFPVSLWRYARSLFKMEKRQFYVNSYLVSTTNRIWFSVVCSLISKDKRHQSGQNVVYS